MIRSIIRSVNFRAGFLVLASHAFILFLMGFGGQGTADKRPNSVLVREFIELNSTVASKVVDRHPISEESISKSSAKNKAFYPVGSELVKPTQIHSVALAPISLPSADSTLLSNPKPPYPIASRENGEQGRVFLNACVNERGKINSLDLAKSSGFHALDRSAMNTVRHWAFIPAQQNGKAIAMCYRLPIHFVLSDHF